MITMVKNLVPSLAERGKIKIGIKGKMIKSRGGKEFQPPQKLDHFLVTGLQRGPDGNFLRDQEVHQLLGDKPRVIPIRLLYDDITLNFACRYTCFQGRKLWCAGDGEVAFRAGQNGQRQEIGCPCDRQKPEYQGNDKCKLNGVLSCLIDGVKGVGGVYKLRTTSWNSVTGILSSLALIQRITGGPLSGIPLNLVMAPKTVISPTDARVQVVYVCSIEYAGTMPELQDAGYKLALGNATHYARIERIEEQAKAMLSSDPTHLDGDSASDVVEEFFPEQAVVDAETGEVIPAPEGPKPDTKAQGEAKPDTNDKPARRQRRNRFHVNNETMVTCGIEPAQIDEIRELSKGNQFAQDRVFQAFDAIGYKDLTFLRTDEADELLEALREMSGQVQAPETPPVEEQPDSVPIAPDDTMNAMMGGGQ